MPFKNPCSRIAALVAASLLLAACSHLPFASHKAATGTVVGVVEFDTGLTKFSTVTGSYHQDMCSKEIADVAVHLGDKEMKKIFAAASKSGFYTAPADLTTNWAGDERPPHCASFRLRIESGPRHNEVRWDCGRDGSSAPPAEVAPVVEQVRKTLRSRKEVKAMPWSSCQVH